jgi:hypothetical protein
MPVSRPMCQTDADITALARRYIAEYLNDHPKELALLSALRKSRAR